MGRKKKCFFQPFLTMEPLSRARKSALRNLRDTQLLCAEGMQEEMSRVSCPDSADLGWTKRGWLDPETEMGAGDVFNVCCRIRIRIPVAKSLCFGPTFCRMHKRFYQRPFPYSHCQAQVGFCRALQCLN